MATQITINKVNYANTASAGQVWTFEYKIFSASTYTLASNSKVAGADGVLASPLIISGLTAGQLYYVRASNNCGSPPDFYVQQIQL